MNIYVPGNRAGNHESVERIINGIGFRNFHTGCVYRIDYFVYSFYRKPYVRRV